MTRFDRETDERLLRYADGRLDDSERAVVERCLAAEPELSARLAAFERSLALTRDHWDAREAELADLQPTTGARRVGGWRRVAAATAGVAAAVALLITLSTPLPRSSPAEPQATQEESVDELLARVRREGLAARMLKTAEILAGDFGEEELSQRRYQQIQEFFPDTGASHTARRRLDTH